MGKAQLSSSKGLWLTQRDQRLLADLFASTVMSRDQILELGYFQSIPRLNRRLKLLCQSGYIRRVEGTRLGTRQTLYACGKAAAPALCLTSGQSASDVTQRLRRAPGLLFLEHTLRITDTRIALCKAAQHRRGRVSAWLSEAECFHEYSINNGARISRHSLKPDGFARIIVDGAHWDFFVEVDCGNVCKRRFSDKIAAYQRYFSLGVFQETYRSESFDVLVVTTSAARSMRLAELAANSPVSFYVVSPEKPDIDDALASVWSVSARCDGEFGHET